VKITVPYPTGLSRHPEKFEKNCTNSYEAIATLNRSLAQFFMVTKLTELFKEKNKTLALLGSGLIFCVRTPTSTVWKVSANNSVRSKQETVGFYVITNILLM